MDKLLPFMPPSRRANENIYEYRLRVARSLGFKSKDADLLALAQDINMIDVAILLDKGCPHKLVTRIMI